MARASRPRLGELLVRAGVITPEQADAAAAVHRANERTIGQQLLADGAVTELDLAAALAYQLDVPFVSLRSYPPDDVAALLTPPDLARRHRVLVVRAGEDEVQVAMADPTDLPARDGLAQHTRRRIVPLLVLEPELDAELERRGLARTSGAQAEERVPQPSVVPAPTEGSGIEGELVPFPRSAPAAEPSRGPQPLPGTGRAPPPAAPGDTGPETQIVRFLLAQAIREQASDLHVEPLADRLRVRFRVEGSLREVTQLPRDMAAPVAARIRALAGMGSGDAQGRLAVREESREATFEVTTVRTLWGEKIVLRLIERGGGGMPDLDDLGMESGTLERWRELLRSPYGLLLVAGAPGMGKTTTLYASVRELPTATKDVTTVEDPVAYALDGVNQVQVDRDADATVASTLRQVVAQEPDVIMTSDLRDKDACDAAMNAALAGRLVLSSVQAPDALAALYRLLALGADRRLVSASVIAVLAQVLLPRLCEHCRSAAQPAMIEAAMLRQAGLPSDRVFVARGCARCNGTGRRGRVAAFELLIPGDELRGAIEREAKLEEARDVVARQGIVSLRDAALRLVGEGVTAAQDMMTRLPGPSA